MVTELFNKYIERIIKDLFFTNELTYRNALFEPFSKDFKKLVASLHDKIEVSNRDVNSLFSHTFQFNQPFSGYDGQTFANGLRNYYSSFDDFHLTESNNEH
ncbi:MAG: hypothetical protein ABIK73_06820 [candidate division WOR-3 bacterium]